MKRKNGRNYFNVKDISRILQIKMYRDYNIDITCKDYEDIIFCFFEQLKQILEKNDTLLIENFARYDTYVCKDKVVYNMHSKKKEKKKGFKKIKVRYSDNLKKRIKRSKK